MIDSRVLSTNCYNALYATFMTVLPFFFADSWVKMLSNAFNLKYHVKNVQVFTFFATWQAVVWFAEILTVERLNGRTNFFYAISSYVLNVSLTLTIIQQLIIFRTNQEKGGCKLLFCSIGQVYLPIFLTVAFTGIMKFNPNWWYCLLVVQYLFSVFVVNKNWILVPKKPIQRKIE